MAKIELDYDKKGFIEAQALAQSLRQKGQEKIALLKKSEDIFLMRWSPAAGLGDLKKSVSPDGKNKLKGAVRLLTATQPKFRVPREKNNPDVEQKSSLFEQLAQTMWMMSNHIQGVKVERDMALSGFLYDEMILNVICMQDVVDNLAGIVKDAADKWEEKRWGGRLDRAKANAEMTPYIFETASPMMYYPQYGRGGVEMVYSEVKRKVADVMAQWGERSKKALGARKETDDVTECTLTDHTFKYVWLYEAKGEPIFADVHDLPMLPTIAVRAEGSRLFEKTVDQYDPFLKTLAESGLWEMQNRIMTATNTNLSGTLNAQWDFTMGQPGDDIEIDHSKFLGVVKHPPGSSLRPFIKDVLSKDVVGAMELVRAITDESTIYGAAMGAGSGGRDPYSLVSLLSQAGRLPLVGVQTMMAEALSRVMEVTFAWMKSGGKGKKIQATYGKDLEVKASDIPSIIRFETKIDVDLPQDKLQQANIATMLNKAQLASREWIQSEFLDIENPEQVRKALWKETATDAMGMEVIKQVIQQMMTPPAPQPQPGQPQGQPSPEQMAMMQQGQGQGQPTPEQMMMMQQQMQQGQGESMQGGLPPEMAGPQPQAPMGQPSQADMSGQLPPEMMGGM